MEIVINDTNILIDLYNAGLLPYCKKLNLDFRTLDIVINEIEDSEQHTAVQSIIDEGTLSVYSLSGVLFLTDMLTKEAAIGCGEMIYALERLLSSNSRLPKKLIKERIEVLKRMNTFDI